MQRKIETKALRWGATRGGYAVSAALRSRLPSGFRRAWMAS